MATLSENDFPEDELELAEEIAFLHDNLDVEHFADCAECQRLQDEAIEELVDLYVTEFDEFELN